MFHLLRRGRLAGPVGTTRTRLSFDTLESRDCPSGWDVPVFPGYDTRTEPSGGGEQTSSFPGPGEPGQEENLPPTIIEFDFINNGQGSFTFYGTVGDENVDSCTLMFFGTVTTLYGMLVDIGSDGSFSVTVQLRTDGSDIGSVVAIAWDELDQQSNEPSLMVNP
jgi:hypothetical protein